MLFIFVEDELSKHVIYKMLDHVKSTTKKEFPERIGFVKGGFGNIRREMKKYNALAHSAHVIVLIDLNSDVECAPLKLGEYLHFTKNPNLIFRIAVREIESWLLVDRENFAEFMGIGANGISTQPEQIDDPKNVIFALARKSRKKVIKEDIPPLLGSLAKTGKNYNGRLIDFVHNYWDIDRARRVLSRKSLDRAMIALENMRT